MAAGYFVPVLLDMPVLSWVGFAVATEWGWSINPSLGYVGQGTHYPHALFGPCFLMSHTNARHTHTHTHTTHHAHTAHTAHTTHGA